MNYKDPKMTWLLAYEKALVGYFGTYANLPKGGVYWQHGHMAYDQKKTPEEAARGYLGGTRYAYLLNKQ